MGRHSYLDQAAQLASQVGVQAVQEGHGDTLALVSSCLPRSWMTAPPCCGCYGCVSDSAAFLVEWVPGLSTWNFLVGASQLVLPA